MSLQCENIGCEGARIFLINVSLKIRFKSSDLCLWWNFDEIILHDFLVFWLEWENGKNIYLFWEEKFHSIVGFLFSFYSKKSKNRAISLFNSENNLYHFSFTLKENLQLVNRVICCINDCGDMSIEVITFGFNSFSP